MEATDNERLDQYRQGSSEALAELVEKYRRPLFGYILQMTEGRGDAEDVFQDVWFRALRKLHAYRRENFFGWLVRIAHNRVIDGVRRRKPEVSLDEGAEEGASLAEVLPGRDEGPMARLQARDLGAQIARAVATLPPEQKEVFLMRVEADLPFKQIARIQRVSINTALARMHYALQKLRPLLEESYRDLGRPG
jgi:RNA polymerase sigma-70 factor, ECF subfamily